MGFTRQTDKLITLRKSLHSFLWTMVKLELINKYDDMHITMGANIPWMGHYAYLLKL